MCILIRKKNDREKRHQRYDLGSARNKIVVTRNILFRVHVQVSDSFRNIFQKI